MFAIRRKGTDLFLALPKGGRGCSYEEPTDDRPPRLFLTLGAAKVALTYWLKGHFRVSRFQNWEGEEEHTIEVKPQDHRSRDDMEIVAVELSIRPL